MRLVEPLGIGFGSAGVRASRHRAPALVPEGCLAAICIDDRPWDEARLNWTPGRDDAASPPGSAAPERAAVLSPFSAQSDVVSPDFRAGKAVRPHRVAHRT